MTPIKGFENQYSITESGKVFSHKKNRFMNLTDFKGYKKVKLRDNKNNQKPKNFLIHRLVADAFIPNPENKPEVNHINSKRFDNSIENLEWATREENNQHAWDYGNKKFVKTEKFVKSVRKNILKARLNRKNNIKD